MHDYQTSIGLLDSLQRNDDESWQLFHDIYVPLIRKWLRGHGLTDNDSEDVAQEVLVVVMGKIADFRRQRVGSFRCWLRNITVNCLRSHRRSNWKHPHSAGGDSTAEMLRDLACPRSELTQLWNREHDRHVLGYAMKEVKDTFAEKTWQAFRGVALDREPAKQVAQRLDMSVNAVCIAKSRVINRIREVVSGLVDS